MNVDDQLKALGLREPRTLWYDKQGQPMDAAAFERIQGQKPSYKRVGGTIVMSTTEPKIRMWVSTVWLGLDHSFTSTGPPIIFETMIFKGPGEGEVIDRYATEEEALKGHQKIVQETMERLGNAASLEDSTGDGFFLEPEERRRRLLQMADEARKLAIEMTNGQETEGLQ